MIAVRIPSALRAYTEGQKEVAVEAASVDHALKALTERYPGLLPHLYDGTGSLRQYVNLFVNEQDVRSLQGNATPLRAEDRLMIIPSIAGGAEAAGHPSQPVDHTALKVNQASIILLLLAAFVLDSVWLLGGVAIVMLLGTLWSRPGFVPIYRAIRRAGWVQPQLLQDHPQPHRFAQGLGAAFLGLAVLALVAGAKVIGWGLAWVVIALAATNLFAGLCVGCAVYYWLQRADIPGFSAAPPPGTAPGRRPRG